MKWSLNKKERMASIRLTHPDDIWLLSQVIDEGDLCTAKTQRKVKHGVEGEKQRSEKKTITLTIVVERTEVGEQLRLIGKAHEAVEDIPKGAHHTIALDVGDEAKICKEVWMPFQEQRLHDASKEKSTLLILALERDTALFAKTSQQGYEVLSQLKGDVEKKEKRNVGKGSFYQETINALQEYVNRFKPQHIIVASPAFWKEELVKAITDPALKKKIVLATCYGSDEQVFNEIMRRPEVASLLQEERAATEVKQIDELLAAVAKEQAVYTFPEVKKAIEAGNAKTVLISTACMQQAKEEKTYADVLELLKTADQLKATIHVINSKHDAGKKLDGLSGVAAITRYASP